MTRVIEKHPYSALALLFAIVLIVVSTLLSEPPTVHSQSAPYPITGYAWSDNIGWVSLNCATGGPNESNVCGTSNYGLSINSSGVISGYAWSDNIGWISANSSDLTGCPSAPCTATISSGGAMSGWLKALAADNNGWDGWISLSGTSPNYGVTETGGVFSGYAYGYVVGWTDFEYASTTYGTCIPSTTYICTGSGNQTITQSVTGTNCAITNTPVTTCVSPAFCSAGSSTCLYPSPTVTGALSISPQLTPASSTVQVSWNISNVESCAVAGSNGDGTTTSTDTNSPGLWNTLSGTETSSAIAQQTVYTLSCLEDDGITQFTETATVNVAPTYQER